MILRPPKLAYFNHDWAVKLARLLPNWDFHCLDTIIKNKLDLVVDPKARKIDELFVRPVNFTQGVSKFMHDHKGRFFEPKDEWER